MIDYLPILIGLLSALLGIFGKSWDENKQGIKRITTKGWITIFIALTSFVFASWTIKAKNEKLSKIADIKTIANQQVLNGVNYMLRDLVIPSKSNDTLFSKLKDTTYLIKIGQQILINPDSSGTIYNGINGGFTHSFELHSANIKYGQELMNDAILKYSSVIDPETIVLINNICNDKFFKEKFTLATQIEYFELAIYEYEENWKNNIVPSYTPWSYLGLYYFNRIDEGKGKRAGSFKDFISLMDKIEKLEQHINGDEKNKLLISDEQ